MLINIYDRVIKMKHNNVMYYESKLRVESNRGQHFKKYIYISQQQQQQEEKQQQQQKGGKNVYTDDDVH